LRPTYTGYRVPSCTPKKTPNSNKAVPYSGALSDRKKLMFTLEYDATFLRQAVRKERGVTAAAANGATKKPLIRLGGWRSDTMAAKYVYLSIKSHISMSELLKNNTADNKLLK
jgi:hypothetical protein